jgi:GNAT superfamily N-acetyltransferase
MTVTALSGRDRCEDLGNGEFLHVFTGENDPRLLRFFKAYDAAFILEDEKEDLDGFKACLALNEGAAYARLSALYGPYREIVILVTKGEAGRVLGAANFIAFAGDGANLTVSLSYIFVDAAERRRGHFSRLVEAVRREARASFDWPGEAPEPLVFIEMNDPVKMAPEDYALDSAHAGLDQVDRLRIWERREARILDLPYRQPPLSAQQTADADLLLGVLGAPGDSLDACLLHAHMRRFFGVTVLKGEDPMQSPVAAAQLQRLEAACKAGGRVALTGFGQIFTEAARVRLDRGMPA